MSNKRNGGRFVSGAIAGSSLMYLLDPDKCGKRRRLLARDKALHVEHVSGQFLDKAVRDLQNRVYGIGAEAWARIREREVPNHVLEQRVRARIGHVVSHPHAITVKAHKGVVTLEGPILEREVERLLETVRSVRGVRDIENCLEPHESPDGVPDLQGQPRKAAARSELLPENWAPATRALAGLGGIGLLSLARRYRMLRIPLGIVGGTLLLRAITNMPLDRALGLSPAPEVITLQKSITINAPVDEIYQLFANPENFPHIFEHVNDVRHLKGDLYQWSVNGPGGVSVSWEVTITHKVPNQLIAWRSVPGAAVSNAGFVRFQQNADGSTTLHIQFTYNPSAGVIGHVIASLFGADPKHALDDDMVRLKSLFEYGKTRVHGQRLTRDELEREIKLPREESGVVRSDEQQSTPDKAA
jgi:uncharacterized membrane protein